MFDAEVAARRWKQGHQAFHVYLVAMNTTIDRACTELAGGDEERLCATLTRLRTLFDAATATMRYASDFSAAVYESVVRPSMSQPVLSPGFSGKLNVDHEEMQRALADLSRSLRAAYGDDQEDWPPEVAKAWRAIDKAKKTNLATHFKICRRFVPDNHSLLRSAPQAIDAEGGL